MKLDSNITAIVTGGASGLGEATVRLLAEKGVKCGIFDLNEEKGEAVAKDVGGAFAKVNVTSDEEVDAGFAKIREALGQELRLPAVHGSEVEEELLVLHGGGLLEAAPDPREDDGLAVDDHENAPAHLHGLEEGGVFRVRCDVRGELMLVVGIRADLGLN